MDSILSFPSLSSIREVLEVQLADVATGIQQAREEVPAGSPAAARIGDPALFVHQSFDFKSALTIIMWSFLLLAGALLVLWRTKSNKDRYPPGPKAYPVIGNLLDFPAISDMVTRVQRWKEDFGSIVYLSAFGKSLIILNDINTATELFETRGAVYSNRPEFPMVGELCGFDRLPAIASDGSSLRLRELRKLLNTEIGIKGSEQYKQIMEDEIVVFVKKLFEDPENFIEHNQWLAVDIIMLISYGYRIALKGDEHMREASRIMHNLSRDAQPGAWLVDLFPVMKKIPDWVPGTYFKQYARKTRQDLDNWVKSPWELIKDQKVKQTSFASRLMEQFPDMTPEDEDLIIWSAASIYSAGSDTTASALTSFFLAMTLFPEALKAAQAEIDNVIGSEQRLPRFSDQHRMPYLNALVIEIFRWGSILPLGAPRKPVRADTFKGYTIPADATLMANIWGMCHNEDVYSNPSTFQPSRFLGARPEPDPRGLIFGFGRRSCPGRYLAEKTLFIAIAAVVSAFDILPVEGAPQPKYEYDDGFISHPKPFQCKVVPRSELAQEVIYTAGAL